MTPAARVQTAIELLDEIRAGAPAERALTGWARRSRFAGSKDRAAIRGHVYDVLRRRNSCAFAGGGEDGRALMLGLLRLDGLDPGDLFTGLPYAPAALTDAESDAPSAAGQRIDLPDWIAPDMRASLGDDFDAIEAALKDRAPVVLRVNLRKSNRATAIRTLATEDITAIPHSAADTALEVTEGQRRVSGSKAYRNGLVELQDASSQAAIARLPLDDGMRVLDYCAGGGGKVLAMAGLSRGSFYAHDAFPNRMRDLPERAKRAGAKVKVLAPGAAHSQAPYDLVFCDVPCSGSGTWRRDPDGKWKFAQDDLDALLKVQAEILEQAAELVEPGGYLAYATCSLLRAENDHQIDAFLARSTDWSEAYRARWTPLDGCDGFFTACLQKA